MHPARHNRRSAQHSGLGRREAQAPSKSKEAWTIFIADLVARFPLGTGQLPPPPTAAWSKARLLGRLRRIGTGSCPTAAPLLGT